MKNAVFLSIVILSFSCSQKTVLELSRQQSMCITGKGPGQDGAINPYSGQQSIAIVKNLGKEYPLSVRIQEGREIIAINDVGAKETSEFMLEPGYQLYFDTSGSTKAEVSFKPAKE